MTLLLGIDTGGTYTDAVLLDNQTGVVSSAKALTTKRDLSIGIGIAVNAVLPNAVPDIRLVSLSTTLATNAVVEGQGSPMCLLLLGYAPDALEQSGLRRAVGDDPVVFIDGGHTAEGEEQSPLDEEAARRAILEHAPRVAAFAVSGYFAVRNPEHERRVRELVRQLSGLPVTCGHELTSNLDAPRRALTTVLNARLIPLLHQLILAVQRMLTDKGIHAPLMVVKGDGSLVAAQVALERPVETILSGPAASVVGAYYLSGEGDSFVVDMGGTTTDIAVLRDGRLVLNSSGATVGGWRTMVEAASVHTFGLGGDSEVGVDEAGQLVVGPRRMVPLSLLAHQFPAVLEVLQRQLARPAAEADDGLFVLRQRALDSDQSGLPPHELEVWLALGDGPQSLEQMLRGRRYAHLWRDGLTRLVERGLVVLAGFTPSDAAHVLGHQTGWSEQAAQLGAQLWVRRLAPSVPGLAADGAGFCQQVLEQVVVQAGQAVVDTAFEEADNVRLGNQDLWRRLVLDRALSGNHREGALVDVSLTLRRPLVAIGAPVGTYYPPVAARLHTQLTIPPHAEVANAVGAVAGGVAQTVRALITPVGEEILRVHLPNGTNDFGDLEAAASFAVRQASQLAEAQAHRAGALHVQLQTHRLDHIHRSEKAGREVYLDTQITVTAVGRPRLAGE
jgi:N-methylhydantoinase A/oxoprolinase/acetone carboxylase beta subunit